MQWKLSEHGSFVCFIVITMADLEAVEKLPIRWPASPVNYDTEIDHVAERRLVRKLDRHIVPLIMFLYLFSFLDRQGS